MVGRACEGARAKAECLPFGFACHGWWPRRVYGIRLSQIGASSADEDLARILAATKLAPMDTSEAAPTAMDTSEAAPTAMDTSEAAASGETAPGMVPMNTMRNRTSDPAVIPDNLDFAFLDQKLLPVKHGVKKEEINPKREPLTLEVKQLLIALRDVDFANLRVNNEYDVGPATLKWKVKRTGSNTLANARRYIFPECRTAGDQLKSFKDVLRHLRIILGAGGSRPPPMSAEVGINIETSAAVQKPTAVSTIADAGASASDSPASVPAAAASSLLPALANSAAESSAESSVQSVQAAQPPQSFSYLWANAGYEKAPLYDHPSIEWAFCNHIQSAAQHCDKGCEWTTVEAPGFPPFIGVGSTQVAAAGWKVKKEAAGQIKFTPPMGKVQLRFPPHMPRCHDRDLPQIPEISYVPMCDDAPTETVNARTRRLANKHFPGLS
jgi:hypothetical protein